MRRGRTAVFAMLAVSGSALMTGCSSSHTVTTTIGISDLAHTRNGCPVPLAAAAGSSAVATASSTVATPGSTLAMVDGAEVVCELTASVGGTSTLLTLTLIATRVAHTAPDVLLPIVQRDDFASVTELRIILPMAQNTAPGSLVSMPGTAPMALAIVQINGAASAGFVLNATVINTNDPEPSRDAVSAIASRLAAQLS